MIVVILVFMLFIVLIIPVDAQEEIKPPSEVAEELDKFSGVISEMQALSLRDFERYTQILTIDPGVKGPPPCPTDDFICPSLDFELQRVRATINVYYTPGGKAGYELVAEYVDEYGQLWRRVINQGPEVWRARGWYIVQTGDLGVIAP